MQSPENDLDDRCPIWEQLQMLYMDTDVTLFYDGIAQVCAQSKYTLEELERILFNEVLPAVRFNMFICPAPEWSGFRTDWLQEKILQNHRYGKSKPIVLRLYTNKHWRVIKNKIQSYRSNEKA